MPPILGLGHHGVCLFSKSSLFPKRETTFKCLGHEAVAKLAFVSETTLKCLGHEAVAKLAFVLFGHTDRLV